MVISLGYAQLLNTEQTTQNLESGAITKVTMVVSFVKLFKYSIDMQIQNMMQIQMMKATIACRG